MPDRRRARPTIRCLTEDLGIALPWLDTDLGELDDSWLGELRRIAPASPRGQKRVLAIGSPLVYRLRLSAERGVTWMDEEHDVVWLCAVHRRQEGSDDDAYTWFAKLHADGMLLPSSDDRLRDRTSAVTCRAGCSSGATVRSRRSGARSAPGPLAARTSAMNSATSCSQPWRPICRTRCSRCGATGPGARRAGGRRSGWACANRRVAPRRSAGCPLRAYSADARRWRRHRRRASAGHVQCPPGSRPRAGPRTR